MNDWIKQSLIRSLWCNTPSFKSGVTSHKMTHQPICYSDWVCSQRDILQTARTTNLKAIYLFKKGASTSGTSLVGELILTITHPLTSSRPSRHSRSSSSSWILSFWNVSSILRERWTRGELSLWLITKYTGNPKNQFKTSTCCTKRGNAYVSKLRLVLISLLTGWGKTVNLF